MADIDLGRMKILVVSDGRAGHVNQSLGLAAALGTKDPEVVTLVPKIAQAWLRWLPLEMVYGKEQLEAIPSADMVIGTGWQVSRVVRWLKEHRGVWAVQLMRPSGRPKDYDVVALLRHDVHGVWAQGASNVVVTVGTVNRITPALLKGEAQRWSGRLKHCPEPRLAVLIGGSSHHGRMGEEDVRLMMESVLAWGRTTGGSLLVTTSRRTGRALTVLVERMLAAQELVPYHFWEPGDVTQRDNPYLAYLGSCEAVVVTAESTSMVSEAATAARPVYLFGREEFLPRKFREFYALLKTQQRLAMWDGRLSLRVPREGLNDAAVVAGFVRARLEHMQRH